MAKKSSTPPTRSTPTKSTPPKSVPAKSTPTPPASAAAKSKSAKEVIAPPSTALLSREATLLRKGDPGAGRILAEERVAVSEGVRKPAKKKP